MNNNVSDREQRIVEGLYIVVAQELAEGVSRENIIARLVREFQVSPEKAQLVVSDAEKEFAEYLEQYSVNNPEYKEKEAKGKNLEKMVYGFICLVGGAYVIWSAYYEGAVNEGSGIAAFAVSVFGMVYFSLGLKGWLKSRK